MSKNQELIGLLHQYEGFCLAEEEIKKKKDLLTKEILQEFSRQDANKSPKLNKGYISVRNRKVWKYSEDVKEMEEDVKKMRQEEQQNGKADYSKSQYLIYKKDKEKDLF